MRKVCRGTMLCVLAGSAALVGCAPTELETGPHADYYGDVRVKMRKLEVRLDNAEDIAEVMGPDVRIRVDASEEMADEALETIWGKLLPALAKARNRQEVQNLKGEIDYLLEQTEMYVRRAEQAIGE